MLERLVVKRQVLQHADQPVVGAECAAVSVADQTANSVCSRLVDKLVYRADSLFAFVLDVEALCDEL